MAAGSMRNKDKEPVPPIPCPTDLPERTSKTKQKAESSKQGREWAIYNAYAGAGGGY
jgi:hypothetical protein